METETILRCDSKAVRWMGYPDIHIPDHDEEALAVAEAAQREFKPDNVIVGNDLFNATPFSRWGNATIEESTAKDWKATELDPANAFIDRVQKHTKMTYFQFGNHDDHIERWAARGDTANRSIFSLISIEANLGRDRENIVFVKRDQHITLHPKLICIHGWSYCKHVAAFHINKSPLRSVIFNHAHRRQEITTTFPAADMPTTAMCAGCLCKRQPMWKHDGNPTGWTHGFWVAYVGSHDFTMYSVIINKGRAILPNGKEVRIT